MQCISVFLGIFAWTEYIFTAYGFTVYGKTGHGETEHGNSGVTFANTGVTM
jgi:hypothetical protein